ncbi:hypothetical protein AHEV_137 [Adoxophyes honmai entomopoxvirus 'L']|uniref:Uncharacterized protein n=1 Tax=Adoxophyes honmai entomopoxvirus 'L' TaxID=1293540 RepID=A0A916KP28_9POXV|nr:hypothetical protein AHEV_137 [Adoxophyes honmai entomopoxvirus 'L']CCU55458.1 hypothetical protein AHEV_137 [Adoxophyes honmai entomopoxvirus 'L']
MDKIILFFKKNYIIIINIILIMFIFGYNYIIYNKFDKSIQTIYNNTYKIKEDLELSFKKYIDDEYKIKLDYIKTITDAHEILISNNKNNILKLNSTMSLE